MSLRIAIRIAAFFAALMIAPTGFSQVRQAPAKQRQAPARKTAPFLQKAKFYEETAYVTKILLRNGLTVLVNEYRSQPVVSVQAHIRAGFFDEPAQSQGVARVIEGMAYRGTSNKIAGTILQEVQAFGGVLKSSTGYDTALFEVVAPSAQWKKALSVLSDAILNLSFNRDELKKEAILIRQEALADLDDPYVFAQDKLFALGFDSEKMRTFLSSGALENLVQENLSAFYKEMYAPSRITLVVSGDVISSEILNEIVRIYDKLPDSRPKPAAFAFTPQKTFRYNRILGSGQTPQLLFGFHAAAENSEDFLPLEVLSAVLGMGEGSVLTARLRDQKGLLLSQETKLTAYRGFSYLTIRMEVEPEQIDRSEIAVLTEIELMKRRPIDEAGLARAFAQLECAYWTQLETVTGKAQMLARFEFLGDWKKMDSYISRLKKVTPSDIQRVAKKYLTLDNCSLLERLPDLAGARNMTAEGARRTLEGLTPASADQEELAREKETALIVSIPSGDGSFKYNEIRYPFQPASILRGPEIYVREDHSTPMIEFGIYFHGGRLQETEENAGITELMLRLMLRGNSNRSAAQFYRQLEIYGGRAAPVVADDYFGLRFSILSRNIDVGINLLIEMIKTPNFDKDEVQRQIKLQLAEGWRRRDSEAYPPYLIKRALFKNFPYALEPWGSEASLARISADSLRGWFDALVKNRKPVVVAIGDTKGGSIATYFVRHFSGSRFQSGKIPDDFLKPLDKGEHLEQNWSKNQSWILVGFQAPPVDDEDECALAVLENYAGRAGRLFQEFRGRKGAAAKTFMIYEPRLRGGSMIAGVAPVSGNEESVFKDLQEEIKRLTASPISYRDYRSAVNAAIGAYWIDSQSRWFQIASVAQKMLAGKGIEGFLDFPSRLKDVKEEDVNEAAGRLFNMEKAVTLRLRGRL